MENLAQLRDILDTDILQIVSVVKHVKQTADDAAKDGIRHEGGPAPCGHLVLDSSRGMQNAEQMNELQMVTKKEPIGVSSVENLKPSVVTSSESTGTDPGRQLNFEMLNCFQALSCIDPRIYKGRPNENFKEFIRRFRRKYQRVILSDQSFVEILADDHLSGRAKSVFLSLPVQVRRRGFEEVVAEMGKLPAIVKLRDLKMRPNQDVAEFVVVLEKLGRKANSEGAVEDRSLAFAQILLANLKHWPEHVPRLSALHRLRPENAYDEVKQLALSIELSKKMYGARERKGQDRNFEWKGRSRYYNNGNSMVC